MTFAEWWQSNDYKYGYEGRDIARAAWNHQQARIDELEAKLNTRAMPEPTEAMIHAGVLRYCSRKPGDIASETIAAVYKAMIAAQENSDG